MRQQRRWLVLRALSCPEACAATGLVLLQVARLPWPWEGGQPPTRRVGSAVQGWAPGAHQHKAPPNPTASQRPQLWVSARALPAGGISSCLLATYPPGTCLQHSSHSAATKLLPPPPPPCPALPGPRSTARSSAPTGPRQQRPGSGTSTLAAATAPPASTVTPPGPACLLQF